MNRYETSIVIALLMAFNASAHAARGDNGEGNGGGKGPPKPFLSTVKIKTPQTIDYPCPYVVPVPARTVMEGACYRQHTKVATFDDFSSSCKLKHYPATSYTVPQTCQREELVESSRQVWQCPKGYEFHEFREKHEVTRVCRVRDNGRGNVGNR